MNPVLLIAIPLLIGFLSVLFKRNAKILLVLTSLFNVVSLFFYEFGSYNIGEFKPPFGINLVLDSYSFVALFFLNILFFLGLIINLDKIKEMAVVLLIALAGLNGMILTHDLFNLFVFIEVSGIAAYILTTQNKKLVYSFQYLVIATVGSGFYLLGLILLYAMVGTLNMSDVASKIAENVVTTSQIMIPVLFMFVGLAIEAKLLPFSSWVKGILENATSLVGIMIASIYAGVNLFVFGRIFTDVFVLSDQLITVFVTIGIITLIAGEFAAFSSNKLREILLFSSVAQAGLIVILFVVNLSSLGVLLIISNILSKFIMFTVAGRFAELIENDEVNQFKGIFVKHKLLGISLSVAALSLAGLPFFFGFFVKINVLYNLFLMDRIYIPAIILITSVVEGAYLIRILVNFWNPGEEGELSERKHVTPLTLPKKPLITVVVLLIAIVIFGIGLLPNSDLLVDVTSSIEKFQPTKFIEELGGRL